MTPSDFRRMARHPSAYAPTAAEVLAAGAVDVPPPDSQLRNVLDDPDADAPRADYAQWIGPVDPARAEFIRLQLAGDPAEALLEVHGARWAEAFAPFGARDFVYRRGFAEGMSLTGRSFISLGTRLLNSAPLREVRLIAVNFLMGELVMCSHLAKLEVLDLSGNRIGDTGASLLSGCEYLEGLRELRLAGNSLTAECEARMRARFGALIRTGDQT